MKRICNISAAFLLSFMIIWMSVGVVMQHCLHTGAVRAVQLSPTKSQEKCAMPTAGKCMQLQVHKLSPADASQAASVTFDVWAVPVAFFHLGVCRLLSIPANPKPQRHSWHSPPRAYLHLLRVLII